MRFDGLSPDVMQAGQILTGATMAAWLLAGMLPRHRARVRAALLVLYLAGVAGFLLYVATT
ncbi:MAG: hypothetical protein J0H99_03970 [Rhodospirillales bacterium]|nr:hypothetical protein [Rhodospirillales bacterium]